MYKNIKILTVTFLLPILLLLFFKIPEPVYAADQSQLISSVNTSSKVIALTFDDCINPDNFGKIVNTLAANNAKATFFAIGSYASSCESQLKLAYSNGNDIANHTYTHPDLATLSHDEIVDEIKSGESAIKAVIGETPKPYFRPPCLSYNSTVLQAAGDAGYSKTILKSVNPNDWNSEVSSEEVKQVVLDGASPGAIVLLHASENTNTPEVLQDIITGLQDKGYTLVTLSELFKYDPNYVPVTGITLNNSTASVARGNNFTLTATVSPSNANDKKVTWKSSNSSVASVDSSGKVTGLSAGTATITATSSDGGFKASCTVTVTAPATGTNLALGKTPTSSGFINTARITDGSIDTSVYSDTGGGLQWVQIDLGASYNVNDIKLWHYYGSTRQYHDVIVRLSNSSSFSSGVTTVFNNDTDNSSGLGAGTNNEYTETSSGKDISFSPVTARYVRFYTNGNSYNAFNHYVEAEVYGSAAVTNLALGKVPSSSAFANKARITDGNKTTSSYSDAAGGLQWIQIDLGASCKVNDIKLWHYYGSSRKYHDVIVRLSNDSSFKSGVTTVFNNDTNNSSGLGAGTNSEYTETSSGKDISFSPVTARYVRFYTNGNSYNAFNHYVEAEVYGYR